MNVAIIPARAGSKGVVGKNYRVVNGRPLVAWSIEAALMAWSIDHIIVSSNCPEVRKIVKPYEGDSEIKATVHYLERPEEFCQDWSSTENVMAHAVGWATKNFGKPEWVTLLQPTSPIRGGALLQSCCNVVMNDNCWDSLVTCSVHTPFFYHRGDTGLAKPIQHSPSDRPMRQLLAPTDFFYHDCGNIYLTKTDILMSRRCRIGFTPHLVPVSDHQALQIDTEDDLALMQWLADQDVAFL